MTSISLMPSLRAPPGEKGSGERSRISWAYSQKVVMTNEIKRSVFITLHFPYNGKVFKIYLSIRTLFEQVWRKTLLGNTVAKVCASPRNSTWFTRLFLLVRGWDLGTRLVKYLHKDDSITRLRTADNQDWPNQVGTLLT